MTGKEIIEEAEKRSGGIWKPSPGLVYPLLGRLLSEGLITETEEGKFKITKEGEESLNQRVKLQEQMEKQMEVLRRLGFQVLSIGKLMVEETLDKITWLASILHTDLKKTSKDTRKKILTKYKAFLEGELERLRKEEKQT